MQDDIVNRTWNVEFQVLTQVNGMGVLTSEFKIF